MLVNALAVLTVKKMAEKDIITIVNQAKIVAQSPINYEASVLYYLSLIYISKILF